MDQLLLQWDCFMSDVIICTITWLPVMTCEACYARLSLRLNWHYKQLQLSLHYTTVLSSLHHYCISKHIWTHFIWMSVQAIDTKGPIYVGLWAALSWGEKQAIQSIWEDPNHPIFPSHSLLHTFFYLHFDWPWDFEVNLPQKGIVFCRQNSYGRGLD